MSSLYEFTVGSTSYRYGSTQGNIVYGGNSFEGIAIERSEVFLDFLNHDLTIKMQDNKEPAASFKDNTIIAPVKIAVRLTDSSNTLIYKGFVYSTSHNVKSGQVVLRCKRFPEAEGMTPLRYFSKSCSWAWGASFREAGLSAGGTISASSGQGTTTGGTNLNTLADGDFILIQNKVFRVTGYDSGAITFEPDTSQAYSSVNWYNVASLKGCPIDREQYKETVTISSPWAFANDGYGITRVLNGASGHALFSNGPDIGADGAAIKKFLYGSVHFKNSGGNVIGYGYITEVGTTSVTFASPVKDSGSIASIVAYQGCSKLYSSCKDKFQAKWFYGGFPYIDRVADEELIKRPSAAYDKTLPEIIGRMWTKLIPFHASYLRTNSGAAVAYGAATTPKTHIVDVATSYLAFSAAICSKSDYLMGIKIKDKVQEIVKSPYPDTPNQDGNFLPLENEEFGFYDINRTRETNIREFVFDKAVEKGKLFVDQTYLSPKLTRSVTGSSSGHPIFQSFRYYDGKTLKRNPGIFHNEDFDSSKSIDTSQDFTDVSYPDVSYVYFGDSVIHNDSSNVLKKTVSFSLGAFLNTKKDPEYGNKISKDSYFEPQALVYHAPSINGAFSYQDFIYSLSEATDTTYKATISIGSADIAFNNVSGTGTISIAAAALQTVVGSGTSFTTELAKGQQFEIGGIGRYVVKAIINNTTLLIEGNNTQVFSGIPFKIIPYFDLNNFSTFIPQLSPGQALKVGTYVYIIVGSTAYGTATLYANKSLLETSSTASISYVDYVGANPANVIYYIMTDILKISSSDIDLTSFTDARAQLYTEEMGVNVKLDEVSQGKTIIKNILDLINGVLYWDATAGNFKLGLLRKANYGSQTINSVKRTFSTADTSDFTVQVPAYSSIYTNVTVTYDNLLDNSSGKIVEEKANELTREIIGSIKVKACSNRFITTRKMAAAYINNKFDEFTKINPTFRFNVAVDSLGGSNPIHEGCLVAYSDSNAPLAGLKIRVDRISGFNEFSNKLSVQGHLDYSMSDVYMPLPEGGKVVDYTELPEIIQLEAIPEAIDPLFKGNFYEDFTARDRNEDSFYSMVNYNEGVGVEYARAQVVDAFTDIQSGHTFNQNSVVLENSVQNSQYVGTLNVDYDPTGWIDNSASGILVDLPAGSDVIPVLDSDEFVGQALISKIDHTIVPPSAENSDYEIIMYKKLDYTAADGSALTAPTATTAGQCRISKIARNLANVNYYEGDPYSSTSLYLAGKTNITGQFSHSSKARIWIARTNLSDSRMGFDYANFNSSTSKVDLKVQAFAETKTGRSETALQRTLSFAPPSETAVNESSPPYINKPDYPAPPAKLYGYTFIDNGQHFFIIYASPANDRSGASWRDPNKTSPNCPPDKRILVEWNDADMGGNVSVEINPSQDFSDEYANKGKLGSTSPNVSGDGTYISGFLFPSSIAEKYEIQNTSIITSTSLGTHPQGGTIFGLRDGQVFKDVLNHACIMIAAPNKSIDIYVSQVRINYPTIKSARRKITLTASTTTLQII